MLMFGWEFTPEFAQDLQEFCKFDWHSFIQKMNFMSNEPAGSRNKYEKLEDLPKNPENNNYILPQWIVDNG